MKYYKRFAALCLTLILVVLSGNYVVRAEKTTMKIIKQPTQSIYPKGSTAAYSVEVSDPQHATYLWKIMYKGEIYNLMDIPTTPNDQILENFPFMAYLENISFDTNELKLIGVDSGMDRAYVYCVVLGEHDASVTSRYSLVQVIDGVNMPPLLSNVSQDACVYIGDELSLSVKTSAPIAEYVWYESFDGSLENMIAVNDGDEKDSSFRVDTSSEKNTYYICGVTGGTGIAYTQAINVVVEKKPVNGENGMPAPVFESLPNYYTDVDINFDGYPIGALAAVEGDYYIVYEWEVSESETGPWTSLGTETLKGKDASCCPFLHELGQRYYRCSAAAKADLSADTIGEKVYSEAYALNVYDKTKSPKITIISQPESGTFTEDSSVNISVGAVAENGSGLAYIWDVYTENNLSTATVPYYNNTPYFELPFARGEAYVGVTIINLQDTSEVVKSELAHIVFEKESSLPVVTPEPAVTEAPVNTPEPTAVPEATATPEPTATPKPTEAPKATETPAATPTPEPTATPAPTATPEPTLAAGSENGNGTNIDSAVKEKKISPLVFIIPAIVICLGGAGAFVAFKKKK